MLDDPLEVNIVGSFYGDYAVIDDIWIDAKLFFVDQEFCFFFVLFFYIKLSEVILRVLLFKNLVKFLIKKFDKIFFSYFWLDLGIDHVFGV